MYTTIVHVYVKKDHVDDFIEATRLNHEASIKETGNRRFDVLQEENTPQKFVLYEAYTSKQEADRHKQTAHYLTWRETVADWMQKPREGILHKGIFPQ